MILHNSFPQNFQINIKFSEKVFETQKSVINHKKLKFSFCSKIIKCSTTWNYFFYASFVYTFFFF